MKRFIVITLAVTLALFAMVALINMSVFEKSDPLAEDNAQVVSIARSELEGRDFDLKNYDISTVSKSESTVVIFMPPNQENDTFGNTSNQPGFEVTVTPDLKVVKISFIK